MFTHVNPSEGTTLSMFIQIKSKSWSLDATLVVAYDSPPRKCWTKIVEQILIFIKRVTQNRVLEQHIFSRNSNSVSLLVCLSVTLVSLLYLTSL